MIHEMYFMINDKKMRKLLTVSKEMKTKSLSKTVVKIVMSAWFDRLITNIARFPVSLKKITYEPTKNKSCIIRNTFLRFSCLKSDY
jgi:hypothetical protein